MKKIRAIVNTPWIPLDKQKPEPMTDALVYFPNVKGGRQVIRLDYFTLDGRFLCDDSDGVNYFGKPTHWMPLPEAPR